MTRNLMRYLTSILILTLLTASVHAETVPFLKGLVGTWSDDKGCLALDNAKTHPPDFDASYLDYTGITGYEWGCTFNLVVTNEDEGYTAISACFMEGDRWPELLLVQRTDIGGWAVTSEGNDGSPNRIEFPRMCKIGK